MRWTAYALLVACMLTSCNVPADPDANALVVGMHEINGVPPIVSSEVLQNLVRFKPGTAEIVPEIARSWSSAANGRVWTFHLHRGLRFSDETPLDAEAVTFNFRRPRADAGERATRLLGDLVAVSALGPATVVLTLKVPYVTLLHDLAQPDFAIAAPALARDPAKVALRPVGSGPYVIVESVSGDHIALAANPHFAGPAPAYHSVVFRVIPDRNTGVLAIEKNDIAVLADPRPEDVRNLDGKPGVTLYGPVSPGSGAPIAVASDIVGVAAPVDGALHLERWKPGGAK